MLLICEAATWVPSLQASCELYRGHPWSDNRCSDQTKVTRFHLVKGERWFLWWWWPARKDYHSLMWAHGSWKMIIRVIIASQHHRSSFFFLFPAKVKTYHLTLVLWSINCDHHHYCHLLCIMKTSISPGRIVCSPNSGSKKPHLGQEKKYSTHIGCADMAGRSKKALTCP